MTLYQRNKYGEIVAVPVEKKSIYLIGSLRNPRIPEIATVLRAQGFDVFDDWYAAGERADDSWQAYETARGHSYKEALAGYAGQHVYQYDKGHIERCAIGVLVTPAGKSGHLELGVFIGAKKPAYILIDAPTDRFDVMYNFATVCDSLDDLLGHLK